jgi:hypothetical protein
MTNSLLAAMNSVGLFRFDEDDSNRISFLFAEDRSIFLISTQFNMRVLAEDTVSAHVYFPIDNDGRLSAMRITIEFIEGIETIYVHRLRNILAIKLLEESSDGSYIPVYGVSINNGNVGTIILRALTRENIQKFDSIVIDNEIYCFGDPNYAHFESSFSNPLLRKGTIAGCNKTQKGIIIDALGYEGCFGSPVFEKIESNGNICYKLIGMVSGILTRERQWVSTTRKEFETKTLINSGFSQVQPIDHVLDLLRTRPRIFPYGH